VSGDPRFHLAAQRTLLAWLRTGIAVMAFGFVLARIRLLARLVGGAERTPSHDTGALLLGVALVALGIFTTATGAIQYQRFCRSLPATERPDRSLALATHLIAWALSVAGVVLAAGLVLT
jgi:inner membrane protein YidH